LRLAHLFDHLVGAAEQRRRHIEAERLRGLEIDHQLVFRRRLHRQIAGFLPFEDAIYVTSGEAVLVNPITSVSDQAASGCEVAQSGLYLLSNNWSALQPIADIQKNAMIGPLCADFVAKVVEGFRDR